MRHIQGQRDCQVQPALLFTPGSVTSPASVFSSAGTPGTGLCRQLLATARRALCAGKVQVVRWGEEQHLARARKKDAYTRRGAPAAVFLPKAWPSPSSGAWLVTPVKRQGSSAQLWSFPCCDDIKLQNLQIQKILKVFPLLCSCYSM